MKFDTTAEARSYFKSNQANKLGHIHNYRLLGQFEGTPKMYECSVLYCHDQADENQVADYEQHIREDVAVSSVTGN